MLKHHQTIITGMSSLIDIAFFPGDTNPPIQPLRDSHHAPNLQRASLRVLVVQQMTYVTQGVCQL
jgi:hypothetical protein